MAGPDDDLDFESLMAESGVRAYGTQRVEGPQPAPPAPPPASATVPVPPRPKAPPAPPPPPDVARLKAELAELRAALVAAEARADAAEATHADSLEQIRILTAERDGLDRRQRAVSEELSQTRTQLQSVTASTALEAVLRRRGLASRAEDVDALLGLLDARADQLVDAVELRDAAPLEHLLEERLLLWCGREQCAPAPDALIVALEVPTARCDVCGGSDIRAKFAAFAAAAREAGVANVVIVGGSPNYRKKIGALAAAVPELRIDLVPGTVRRPRHKAEADMKRADVVVIWGATILDHSISENYRPGAGKARMLTVRDRGITRMLDEVRRFVAG